LAWFETVEGEPDPIQLRDALNDLDAIVGEAAATHQIDLSDIVVAGFSQGAALSLAWLLDSGERGFERSSIGGIIAVAPWFIDAEGLSLDPARGAGVAVFIGHGTDDDIVPLPLGRGAARLLERNGALIEFRELAAAHALAPFLAVGRDWLAALLTGPSNASPI